MINFLTVIVGIPILFLIYTAWIVPFLPSKKKDTSSPSRREPSPRPSNTPTVPTRTIPNINIEIWKTEKIGDFNDYPCLGDYLILREPSRIFYGDLLKSVEWKYKRLTILFRDNYECFDCSSRHVSNHVHHKYYIKDKLPWEIEDDALVTLCRQCHIRRHENSRIPVYLISSNRRIEVSSENPSCGRCGGTGYIEQYSHVQGGVCFRCWGNLVSRNVFDNPLQIAFRNLNSYNESMVRSKYINFFNNVTEIELIDKFPDYRNYIREVNPACDDDLPF